MDRPGDAKDADDPHEEDCCLPVHEHVHYFRCGNLICAYHHEVQECAIPVKSVYAACKCCGTLHRITR